MALWFGDTAPMSTSHILRERGGHGGGYIGQRSQHLARFLKDNGSSGFNYSLARRATTFVQDRLNDGMNTLRGNISSTCYRYLVNYWNGMGVSHMRGLISSRAFS